MSTAGEASPATPFGDRLAGAVAERESQIVLGIDPEPGKLWPDAVEALVESRARLAMALADVERSAALDHGQGGRAPRLEAAAAVLGHCLALIDAAGPACVAAKPQLACFERLGFPGWLALEATVAHARAQGLLVIADAKRGDISESARAYEQAVFGGIDTPYGPSPGLGADAVTLNPLLGRDALAPFVEGANRHGAGVFVLVRTSNPGAADLFDAELASGGPLWERIAGIVAAAGTPGPESGLAEVGAVTGATVPQHLARMRELMPHAPFLLPGIGAQGGSVADLAPAFSPGRAAGLVSASRSIANAHETAGTAPPAAARAEAERLREAAWALA
ncbi:MAG TPA: orotidine-5'-phosphate decarboxylase [Solirubrobacteraceae bacterium]|nr:orotidine-5'-phosphate decarboxylase [Solirubrobacteraceae bacterium]